MVDVSDLHYKGHAAMSDKISRREGPWACGLLSLTAFSAWSRQQ